MTPPDQAQLEIVLVDADDVEIGRSDKLGAHRPPAPLHRAVSVMLTDSEGRYLLQRRADSKYHFAGLWANTACGHPAPGERVDEAARRRLRAELGVAAGPLHAVGTMTYAATDPQSGLMEHELDHVLIGSAISATHPNPEEVAEIAWVSEEQLTADLDDCPERFAPWLAYVLPVLIRCRGRFG
ncbi:MAG: isopentenyl-diphosphate Delta-isomerase [Nostocoides sp.]